MKNKENKLLDFVINESLDNYRRTQSIRPIFYIEMKQGLAPVFFPPEMLNSRKSKIELSNTMKKIIKKLQASDKEIVQIIYVCEVSMTRIDANDKEKLNRFMNNKLERQKNSDDKLMISVETPGLVRTIIYDIIRTTSKNGNDGDHFVLSSQPEMDFTSEENGVTQIENIFSFLN